MRADRLLTLILLLQTHGKITTRRLAEELGVSRRTILRDVEALSFSGVPIYSESGPGGGVALDEHYRTSLTGLNTPEVQSLFVSNNDQILQDIGLGNAAQRLLMKLLAALPQSQHSTVDHIRQRLMIDPTWWWHETAVPPFWDDLQNAVYQDRLIKATYENYEGVLIERVLAPYSLICKSSLWYVLAEYNQDLHTYRVSRFHSLQVLNQNFLRRPDFDLPTYWQTKLQGFAGDFSEYRCTLRIPPQRLVFVKGLMAGRWEQTAGPDSAGWVTLSFKIDSEQLAKMLVFGLAGDVEIIDPPELRASVLAQCQLLFDQLASPNPS
jgi:predicted DNA-binding transcriptional regulator YafY